MNTNFYRKTNTNFERKTNLKGKWDLSNCRRNLFFPVNTPPPPFTQCNVDHEVIRILFLLAGFLTGNIALRGEGEAC